MKKSLLLGVLFLSLNSYGQKFVKMVDEFEDTEYVIVDGKEVTYNGDSESEGVLWGLNTSKIEGQFEVTNISLGVYGLGCVEETNVIIIFENGEKINKTQWNKFNCEGDVWIRPNISDIELISNQPVSSIRVTNGRNFESYTFRDLDESMKNYFINLFKSLDDGNTNGFDLLE
ncbi:MAG: hypothetical protein QNK51_00410 [Chitinophagales bacterium]